MQASPLWVAAALNRLQIIRILVAHGAEMNAVNDHGVTPLATAVERNNIDVVRFLLDRKADIDKVKSP